mgnify:CR=1 FL=1
MATNEFKAFATAGGANVLSQEEYLALAALSTGFQSGIAKSAEINKALRQATTGVAALAQFISEATDSDINDNGDVSALVDKLAAALAARGLSRENPFADIAADGTENQALANLGLGEGSALPVGVPVPWPGETAPEGWLKCNGASFDTAKYPKLALAYPSGKLPDLRGEFIRGWDDGRGVDSGRTLLATQSDGTRSQSGSLWVRQFKVYNNANITNAAAVQNGEGVFSIDNNAATNGWDYIENTRSGTTSGANKIKLSIGNATETRPRNVAFNYIVRAA